MWAYKLFRIGAAVLAVGGGVHLAGFLGSRRMPPVTSEEFRLYDLLYGYKMNFMGTMRSQGEIFDGLSLAAAIFFLTLAALGFTVPVQRKTAIVIAAALAVMTGVSLQYWFLAPTAFIAAGLPFFAGSAYLDKK